MRRLAKVLQAASPERGATAIVVALLMTVLLGAAGLAIDLGASFAKEQELQNGADAAALALAQEYSQAGGCKESDPPADNWVTRNITNETPDTSAEALCPSGVGGNSIRVIASDVQTHWFMPALGRDSSEVRADATVEWGVPVAGGSLPLTISNCKLSKVYGDEAYLNVYQDIWMNHPSDELECAGEAEGLPDGGFNWLDTAAGACESFVRLDDEGDGGWTGGDPGVSTPKDCDRSDWEALVAEDEPILVPVFDYSEGDGNWADYHIVKFAAFDLKGMYLQSLSGPGGSNVGEGCEKPKGPEAASLQNCIFGAFVGIVTFENVDLILVPPNSSDSTIIIRLID